MILQAIKSVHFNYKFHHRQQRLIPTQPLKSQIVNHQDPLQIRYRNISYHQKKKRKGLIVKLLSEISD